MSFLQRSRANTPLGVRATSRPFLGYVCTCWFAAFAVAGDPIDGTALQQQLRAGDFAGALRSVRSAPAVIRDGQLADIALAQSAAGKLSDAVETASYVSGDQSRRDALQQIARQRLGAKGGGSQADFDTLIELITTTVEPEAWEELGGPGAIDGFEGGVHVDTSGLLQRVSVGSVVPSSRRPGPQGVLKDGGNRDPRQPSELRKVSLTRLERQLQLLAALGKSPTSTMQVLAGIAKVEYVFVCEDTGDVILAGPAGAWQLGDEGRVTSVTDGQPVLHLDDLVVLLRNALHDRGRFGCSITPRPENLGRAKAFLAESADRSLRPGERDDWLANLRRQLDKQDIHVHGIDPRSRTARVIVEADYRMKLVGMGIEEGVPGVDSYLDTVRPDADGNLPALDVLRWWFTLDTDALRASQQHDVFEIGDRSVKVLSENELLTETGKRVHTGQSDELNQRFARSFTQHFGALAAKYPVYAELRNVFDLALVAAVIVAEDLPGRLDWQITYYDQSTPTNWLVFFPHLRDAPREVMTVVNHRVINRRHIVAGVSGGVVVDTASALQKVSTAYIPTSVNEVMPPKDSAHEIWWWD